MNGHEVFRNHLPAGAITASTTAEGAYESLMYRFVSLPYRTIAAEDAPSVEYLKEGSNTIAIALIGLNPAASSASTFDAVLRTMGDDIKGKKDNMVAVLSAVNGDKVSLLCVCGAEAVKKGAHAGKIIKEVAKIVGGGGGGRPDSATAGGKNPAKLEEALEAVNNIVDALL